MRHLLGFCVLSLIAGCGDSTSSPDLGGTVTEEGINCPGTAYVESVSTCMASADDYTPRTSMSSTDTWPACNADDGIFDLVGPSLPAAAARTSAFEAMGQRLWNNPNALTAADFVDARNAYSIDQGIGSRVERRQDVHYPETPGPDKFACSNAGVPAMYPDRCAGPAKLLPIVNTAFQDGIASLEPRVASARLEAALVWFFYLSTMSEIWTCGFDDILDCDSVWGYFNGAQQRAAQAGLGRYIKERGPETYERAFDAVLAERCWRDVDQAMPAVNSMLRDRASAQLDRAQLRGLALIARERLGRLACSKGQWQRAHHAFLQVLLGMLDRESTARDAAKAATLRTEIMKTDPASVNVTASQAALDALYPCP